MKLVDYMKIVERNTPNWPQRDIYRLAYDLYLKKFTESESKDYIRMNFA